MTARLGHDSSDIPDERAGPYLEVSEEGDTAMKSNHRHHPLRQTQLGT